MAIRMMGGQQIYFPIFWFKFLFFSYFFKWQIPIFLFFGHHLVLDALHWTWLILSLVCPIQSSPITKTKVNCISNTESQQINPWAFMTFVEVGRTKGMHSHYTDFVHLNICLPLCSFQTLVGATPTVTGTGWY